METLQTALKSLRLGGLAKTLPVRYQEAKANELDYLEFIDNLITDELDRRKENLLNRRIKTAKFPQLKSIDEFNFSFNTTVSKKNIMEMMTSRFVYNAKNTLFIGPPGVGKTHLSINPNKKSVNSIMNLPTIYRLISGHMLMTKCLI